VHVAMTAPPPQLPVMHAVPVNYNVPPPAVQLAASAAPQLSYVTVAHTLSSAAGPANVVCNC